MLFPERLARNKNNFYNVDLFLELTMGFKFTVLTIRK